MHNKAFTLVELIVVITILAILWTIAFVSFQWFSKNSRDSVRISDVNLINKSLKLYVTREGVFPIPDNSNNITFSWATAWHQWEFGTWNLATIRQMNKAPRDPLTWNLYAYSRTALSNEYQLAAALEWTTNIAFNFWITPVHANTQIGYSYIRWNYNKQFLSVSTWSVDYILAVPSIIASDILDATALTIAANQAFAFDGTTNLPSSYSGSNFDTTSINGFNYPSNANDIIVYSWSLEDLSSQSSQLALVTNLQNAYTWTAVWASVDDILAIDVSIPEEVNNFIALVTNTEVGGLEPVWLQKVPVPLSGGWGWGTTDVLFYIGGLAPGFATQDNVYASSDNWVSWSEVGTDSFPVDLRQCSARYFNGKLLVVWWTNSDKVYSTIDGTTWVEESTLPTFFWEFELVEYQGKLWAIGWFDGTAQTDKIFSSVDGTTWLDTGIALAAPTWALTSIASFNNRIWIIGWQPTPPGWNTDAVYSFDGTTLVDSSDPSVWNVPSAWSWWQAYVLNNTLFNTHGFSNVIHSSVDGSVWVDEQAVNSKSLPASLWLSDVIVLWSSAYIVGWFVWSDAQDSIYQSSNGLDWTLLWNLPAPRGQGCLWRLPLTVSQIANLGL